MPTTDKWHALGAVNIGNEAIVRRPGCSNSSRQPFKSRQARYSLNWLPVHHLPASPGALAGQQCIGNKGVPEFPSLPTFPTESIPTTKVVPGVYRLTFNNGHIYIGKAKNLRLRFGNYRKPTSGTEQEHVVHSLLSG
jgi:hypothetical protein